MKYTTVFLTLCTLSAALPRQELQTTNRLLDEPLSDPELRRTLLRVFAESLRAAAQAGAAGARSAVNVPQDDFIDLTPPSEAAAQLGFGQQPEELLLLSGDSEPQRSRSGSDITFTTTEPALASEFSTQAKQTVQPKTQGQQEASLASEFSSFTNGQQFASQAQAQVASQDTPSQISLNTFTAELQGDSSNQQGQQHFQQATVTLSEPESRTESSPAQPPAEPTFPGPSPAPPSPIPVVTLDDSASNTRLSPDDKNDVQRFVSAVSSSGTTDESLGDGVELFKAPLIAAFALQQDGSTGHTKSLFALPVSKEVTEELLNRERQILSVAGQVVGQQKSGIFTPQQTQFFRQQHVHRQREQFRPTIEIQRSVQPNFNQQSVSLRQLDAPNLALNEIEPQSQLQRLERRQQELQQQLVSLQRERSALLLQRNTRSDVQPAASNNNFGSIPNIPIFLQPPFF